MVRYSLLILCLVAKVTCFEKTSQSLIAYRYELQYENINDGISLIDGIDTLVPYKRNKIEIGNIKNLSWHSEIDIRELLKFELISGTKSAETAISSKDEIEKKFIQNTKAYYLGAIANSSILILTIDKNQYASDHSIFLLNFDDKSVKSIARVAYLFDLTENIYEASTKITDSYRFEYTEEEVLSDVTIIGGQEEENIPVIFEIDKNGRIQIVR